MPSNKKIMKRYISLFVLLLFQVYISEASICDGFNETSTQERTLDALFDHCMRHKQCAHQFGLDTRFVNRTTFEIMMENVITNHNEYYEPLQAFCSMSSPDEIMEFIWPFIMLAESQENFLSCPLGFDLRINLDGTQQCVCSTGSDCSNSGNDDTLLLVFLILAVVSSLVLTILLFTSAIKPVVDLFKDGPLAEYKGSKKSAAKKIKKEERKSDSIQSRRRDATARYP